MEEFYDLQTLPNGVRIVTEHVPAVRSACLGLWVGTGSRHEKAGEGGAAPRRPGRFTGPAGQAATVG